MRRSSLSPSKFQQCACAEAHARARRTTGSPPAQRSAPLTLPEKPTTNIITTHCLHQLTSMADDRTSSQAGPSSRPEGPDAYRPSSAFSFPAAFQPSIIRSFQKDSYYLSLLQAQLSDVTREVFGSRFLQLNSNKITLLASIAYYVFTTAEGAQTLGEEYVGARMVGARGKYVSKRKRIAFILTQILAPFLLSRIYAMLRRRVNASHISRSQTLQRAKMRWKAIHGSRYEKEVEDKEPQPSRQDRLVAFTARILPSVEDLSKADGWLAYASAFHLMLFYLGGKYYKVAQRLVGVRYVSSRWYNGLRTRIFAADTDKKVLVLFLLDLHPSFPTRPRATLVRSTGCPSGHPAWRQASPLPQSSPAQARH